MIGSLRLRLAVGATIAIAIVLLMVWLSLSRLFTDYVIARYQAEMTVLADSLAAGMIIADGKLKLDREPSDPRLFLPGGGRYWQIEPEGQKLIRSRSLWDTVLVTPQPATADNTKLQEAEGPDGLAILVLKQKSSIADKAGERSFVVSAGFAKSELDEALAGYHGELNQMMLWTGGMLTLAAVLQGLLGLRPLTRLKHRVAAIRSGASRDMGSEGPTELVPLVNEINLLLAERETAVERARARASDLAHGLKTPLTVLTYLIEKLDADSKDIGLKQIDLIRQRADRQLQAARLGVEQMASTNLLDIAGKLAKVLHPVISSRSLALTLDINDQLAIAADAGDVAEALGNILDNAVKWARSTISIAASQSRDRIRIEIGDDGPGVDPANYPLVLKRGGHLETESSGSGLGLAISADITDAYHGSLTLGRSALGGLQVTLEFPVARKGPVF